MEEQISVATLSLNEIMAVSAILQFYEKHMWNTTMPSAKRSQRQVEVAGLIVKLALLPSGQAASLTRGDLGYINTALRIFITQVTEKIPPSDSRGNLLISCEQVQTLFSTLIPANLSE
ncbi:hypothetical protein KSF_084350 [Reticulibacter mediterranei]|uniref:Uncharacterized protein n=1 Tax=Reticulibacter mediterranei TaxID=2778369 RepID=A0A8J3N8L9_9CHLR|nr:hypothetical protein [Reticulibacter mediterranei]GHO98387.1 hypothetical protein KSF_084350 [Reticulibacter mediterranei]